MRNKKLIVLLIVCIFVVVSVMIYRTISKNDGNPAESVVTTGQVARAIALLEATDEECNTAQQHFKKNQDWYVPYMNFLYDKGYFEEKQIAPTRKQAGTSFSYHQLEQLFDNMQITDKELLSYINNNKPAKAVTNKEWAEIFSRLSECRAFGQVNTLEMDVVATVSNVSSLDSWKVVTTEGEYIFTGLSMDYYIDKRIEVQVKDNQILCINRIVSENVTYANSLITSIENGQIHVFLNGVNRTFEIKDKEISATNGLVDISLKKGKVTDYKVKQDYISGKLLKYTDQSVEIEGQGTFPISENIRVYKIYGNVENKTLYDMVVGYDVQKFLIEDGKVCAVLIDRNFVADNIRVVIKTTGFNSIYHDSLLVSSDKEFVFSYGGETRTFAAGEECTITRDSKYLAAGNLKITTSGVDGKITLKSLERGYGTPSYRGSIEIVNTENGLVVINELGLEEYLYAVIPSEMPYTYSSEALKAQAVCARSYAYKQMMSNTYAYLGAHVDDSTSFQVYNNSQEQATTTQAVKDTYGQIMMCNGQPISAFFYSTSCGSSTDADIWGGSGYEYIRGHMLCKEEQSVDLTDEAQFKMFITNSYDTYDKDYGWYRWNVTIPLGNLTNGVNNMLASLYASGPEKVLTKVGNDYVSREISSVGNVISIETGTRGTGGVLQYMIIYGDEATVMIKTESFIRKIINPNGCVINKQDGSTVDTFTSLPSAFFAVEEVKEGESLKGYTFYGGGYGHGAGMSQNAANTMGNNSIGYQDILNFFYNNITIENIY